MKKVKASSSKGMVKVKATSNSGKAPSIKTCK